MQPIESRIKNQETRYPVAIRPARGQYAILVLMLTLLSCGKELEQSPTDAFDSEYFWNTESDAMVALTGMYRGDIRYNTTQVVPTDWWTYCGIVFLECATDNAYDRRGDNSTFNRLSNGTLLANNNVVDGYWTGSYKRIAICNNFLENIERVAMEEEKIRRMIAEARFLRATQYFYLSQFWGDVPLVTSTLTPDEANRVSKTPKSEIVQFVDAELEQAAADLPLFRDLTGEETGRACKQAALGFLGRLYLGEEMFEEASEVYREIIETGDHIIDPDYSSIFIPANENSAENIFSVQYHEGLAGNGLPQHALPAMSNGWHIINPLGSLAEQYDFEDGTPFSYDDPRFDHKNMAANRDPRFSYTFLWDNCMFQGKRYVCHPDSTQSLDQLTYSKQATRTGYGLRKFFDESFSGDLRQDYGGNIPIIRYAEVLLGYLEAELEAGRPVTQDLLDLTINAVRGRESVNMPPVTETDPDRLRSLLRKERRVELALEGIRYWDILRWDIGEEVLTGDFWGAPFPDSKKYPTTSKKTDPDFRWYVTSKNFRKGVDDQWPVPESEVNVNPNLGD